MGQLVAAGLLILDRRWDQDWDYDRAGLDRAAPSWGCGERRGQRTASPGAPADHHSGRGWPDNTRAGIPLSSDQVSGVVLTTWQEN